jgi:hypothetical protein
MKKFYDFSEALILSLKPESDVVAPATQCDKCDDMFSTTANDYIKSITGGDEDVVQPDSDVGETGEIESGSETSGVELECMGEEGVKVKVNGMEFLLPKMVIDAIKSFESEPHTDTETEEEHEEHEAEETKEEEAEEHDEVQSEKEEDDETVTESEKKGKAVNPWAVCNRSTGGKKKAGKEKFERCVMDVKKKHKIKK